MPYMKVHQYIASKADDESLDDIIATWTRPFTRNMPDHSHSELEFPWGMCISSTLRDDAKGVRWITAETLLRNAYRWDSYFKEFSKEDIAAMHKRALAITGKLYNKIGLVLDFTLPFGWLGGLIGGWLNQWYCSQAVYYILTGERKRISPRRLTRWMLENGWKKVAR
jgi:hypothetical protein